jgi:plastocyanin
MNKSGWMWFILVGVIIIAIALVIRSNKAAPADDVIVTDGNTNDGVSVVDGMTDISTLEKDAKGNVIVRYTETGFIPTSLILAKGASVTFRNDASSALQISPADQTNQPYASFNQDKSSLKKGASWSYTFGTVGSYTYYNENKKTDTGVITIK